MAWNEENARNRISESWDASANVTVKPLVKETSLDSLSLNTAYEVDGVHVYVDIPNALTLIGGDAEHDHKKVLRFLHVMARVAHLVFDRTDGVKVDIQNTRLHFVVYKPYDSEADRICAAVAIADVLRGALLAGNALHAELPDARVVIGLESGRTLAVRNGTRGEREPLFLGSAANHAAKLTGQDKAAGMYMGRSARASLGADYLTADPSTTPLKREQIEACVDQAGLTVTSDSIAEAWAKELENNPISDFSFSRWTPPLAGVSLDELTPGNSRRQELVVMFADIDGFTDFVANAIGLGTQVEAVRVLHVIRKEMREVLNDLGGKKARYIGDCVQGLLVEGTAQTTDREESVLTTALCAAAMRSSFDIIRAEIPAAARLGIQIGFELGSTAVSRVGVQGSRDRIVISHASLQAEAEQRRCSASETAIGAAAFAAAPIAVRDAFGPSRKSSELDYNRLCARLNRNGSGGSSRHGIGPTIPDPIRRRAYAG